MSSTEVDRWIRGVFGVVCFIYKKLTLDWRREKYRREKLTIVQLRLRETLAENMCIIH